MDIRNLGGSGLRVSVVGLGCNNFGGRTDPEPSRKVIHKAIDLAEKLKSMAPVEMSKVFFANSGSEANDTVVKMVWYMNNALDRPKKKKIISRIKAYHGITVASGSLTGLPHNHRSFDLPIANILHTSCPHYYRFGKDGETEDQFTTRCAQELEELIIREGGADEVAAMICEPVMGAGGVIVPPALAVWPSTVNDATASESSTSESFASTLPVAEVSSGTVNASAVRMLGSSTGDSTTSAPHVCMSILRYGFCCAEARTM